MLKVRWTFAITLAIALAAALGSSLGSAGASGQRSPEVVDGEYLGVSPAVRDLAPADSSSSAGAAVARSNPDPAARGTSAGDRGADPLADGRGANGRTPATNLTFDGVGNPEACAGCLPPDTTGDVGPNHYIQMVNATKVAIFNKSGTAVSAPFDLSTLFPATTGSCSTSDAGDPQVLYDPMANRWVLAQFQLDNRLCFAVSQTADPTGSYFTYGFVTAEFPDYFKLGVWPTGYYVSTNESTYKAYAFDRTAMLAGDPATSISFSGETNFLMPADVDGPTAPTSQGGLFYTFKDNTFHGGADRLELFRLTPDFATPGNSTFSNITDIPIAPYTYTVCGFFVLDCVPQPGTAEGLDAVSEWPMQRFAYRRFPGREVLLGNFTVDVGSDRAGIRWFELRNTGSGYTLFQQGTHAPGTTLHRFMGSIAMDQDGNIALGYSVSSGSVSPGIRYATRAPGDPLGTLQAEQTLQAGGGSQTSSSNRWGDYSMMSVDPADDCSFWYTNEYYTATSSSTWSTKVGRFKEPTCGAAPPRQLTVTTAGSGSGFVDSAPAGIDCGLNTPGSHTDCGNSYADGTSVTLTAHPDANTDFTGFTGGGCAGSVPSCTVSMTAARSVTATFAQTQRQLTVTTAGSGSGFVDSAPAGIDCGLNTPGSHTDCGNSYADGTSVTLTAHPDANTDFTGFSGGGCAGTSPCAVTMDAAKSVTATFAQQAIPPSNAFSTGKVKRNTKKGTAKIPVTVPGPGELTLTGKQVKSQKRAATKPVSAAGTVNLKVKAKAKAKKRLKKKGKVKVKVTITYTPTGGTPASQTQRVKLKLKT